MDSKSTRPESTGFSLMSTEQRDRNYTHLVHRSTYNEGSFSIGAKSIKKSPLAKEFDKEFIYSIAVVGDK